MDKEALAAENRDLRLRLTHALVALESTALILEVEGYKKTAESLKKLINVLRTEP